MGSKDYHPSWLVIISHSNNVIALANSDRYLIAQVLRPITKYFSTSDCDTFSLRLQNCFAMIIAIPIVAGTLHKLLQSQADSRGAGKPVANSPGGGHASYFTVH